MKAWLTCFFVLFALAKLFLWLKGFMVPMPIYILGGAFLAIASNYEAMYSSSFASRVFTKTELTATLPPHPLAQSKDTALKPSNPT